LHKFPGKDLGESAFFLQMLIKRDRSSRVLYLKQQRHIEKLLDDATMGNAKPLSIPMNPRVYEDSVGQVLTSAEAITQYTSLVGALMHLSNSTRPDIDFAVQYLARFMSSPPTDKVAKVKDILLYFKGTSAFGLRLGSSSCIFHGFCDADFA
jgi:hypothetical protein